MKKTSKRRMHFINEKIQLTLHKTDVYNDNMKYLLKKLSKNHE